VPRLFVALDLPAPTRAALAALAVPLPGARWVAEEQIHLTLRFLGHVPDEEAARVTAALTPLAAGSFTLALAGVGVFPPHGSRRPPRVLWVGIAPAAPVLALKAAIDGLLGPDPESAERGFSPHVTLARFKEAPGPALGELLERHRALASPPWTVDAVRLYESRTTREGAVYTPLATYALQGGGRGTPGIE
jgi:2'-5' RNA ligase